MARRSSCSLQRVGCWWWGVLSGRPSLAPSGTPWLSWDRPRAVVDRWGLWSTDSAASALPCSCLCSDHRSAPAPPRPWGSRVFNWGATQRTYGGRPGQHVEEQGTWASRTQKHSEAGYGRPVDRGAWTAKTVKRPPQQPAHPQYANHWAPLTRKRHTMPHSAQPQHTNYWAPRTQKRHQQEHWPQRLTESSDPTQHAKGRPGDCPGFRKGTTTRMSHRGVNRALQNRGAGVREKGSIDRTVHQFYELWPKAPKNFLSIENGQFFFHQIHGK